MKFRIYEVRTSKDVTDEQEWYIDIDGNLWFMTNDIDSPLSMANEQNYSVKMDYINNI